MEKFKNHLLGHCVFCRVARPTGSNTVGLYIPNGVVNPINSVIQNMAVPVFWSLNKIRFNPAVKAILLSYRNKFINRKLEVNSSVGGVPDVVIKKNILRIGPKRMSRIRIASVCSFPILFSYTAARGGFSSLNAADPCLKLFSAITLAFRKIMVRILRVASRYTDDGEIPNAHSGVFGFCAFSYHLPPQRLLYMADYTLVWDKFQGKTLRGLTLRRQREYQKCIT